MLIYKIQNKINGKIYIGQTINSIEKRFGSHIKAANNKKNNSIIYKAIRKYGVQSFEVSVIDEAKDKETLNEKEKYWIKFYNSMDLAIGYNMAPGGEGGDLSKYRKYRPHTEETKAVIRARTKEAMAILPPEKKEKLKPLKGKFGKDNPNYGRKASPEEIKKLSESHKGLPNPNKGKKFPYKARKPRLDMIGENNPAKRPDVRKKISENNAMKNPELRAKCKGNSGKKYSYKARPKAKGRVSWNKGLTKETDERVRKISETEKNTKAKERVL